MWRVLFLSLLAAVPSSANYSLPSYDFGSGAGSGNSTNYNLRGSAGSDGGTLTGTTYALPAGIQASTTVAVPAAPTFTNPDTSYNRLKLVITPGSAPSDTKFAVAISTDDFATTKYVQPDQTIGTSFSVSTYQTYAAWGSTSGVWVLGLANSTTYKVKVAALQGSATGSGFGPTASAATSAPTVSFGVTTSLTSTPPFSATFTSLPSGSVTAANATVTATLTANTQNGGQMLIKDQNGGLNSALASYTITSASADLTAVAKGYGAQVTATSQASGGPLVSSSPFNGAGNNVGALTSSWQELASFAAPLSGGSLTFGLSAKADTIVPAATDYSDVLTLSVSLLF